MRLIFLSFLALILAFSAAQAQSVMDNLPPALQEPSGVTPAPVPSAPPVLATASPESYTVTDVNADVTADTASHARDQAIMQAERTAYSQFCVRMGVPDHSAKLSDDALASLVQSFEVQNERLSAVRYIGVFTIRFKPSAMQKKLGIPVATEGAGVLPQGPAAHLTVAVQTDSLAAWSQIKLRLGKVPQVAKIDTLDLGRGVSHIDLSFSGSLDDLRQAVTTQGLVLRQNEYGVWELYDGSIVPR